MGAIEEQVRGELVESRGLKLSRLFAIRVSNNKFDPTRAE